MCFKKIIEAQAITTEPDSPALICVWETGFHVPFEIRRVYHTSEVKVGEIRGHHAHRTLEQVLICPTGSIEVTLDNGRESKSFVLDQPHKGLYVGPAMWRTMKWLAEGSVLLVFASQHYNEVDYIRNYEEFLNFANQEKYN